MKRMTPFLYMMCAALLMIIVTGCNSTGYSGSSSYYHRNTWEYDNDYRYRANDHYNRSAARANVRSDVGTRAGGAARSGGGGGRGGGGGGGRR
jgi:uncharacterized membrane protein YgcG